MGQTLNSDNLTPDRVDRLIASALKKFERWERKVDLEHRELTDDLYRDYQIARELAEQAAVMCNWRVRDAKNLP